MNPEPDQPSDDALADAYRGWARRQLGNPPPFRAPRPSAAAPVKNPWRWAWPVGLAGVLAALVLNFTMNRPAPETALFVYEMETLPWPSDTDFLLQWPDSTFLPQLIIEP